MDFNTLQKLLYFVIVLLFAGIIGFSVLLISALIENFRIKNNN